MTTAIIRPRHDTDLPPLGRALVEQQAASGYPHRHPLPMAAEEFIVRRGELAAWVAEVDGVPVGHVAISTPSDPDTLDPADADVVRTWMRAHGRTPDALGEVNVFFTATAARGTGAGRDLLATAVEALGERGLAPCLDVVPTSDAALRLYRRSGWQEVGTARPGWLADDVADVIVMILPVGPASA
ncbi:MAG: GNAT family N-acetyltransferase [Janibacter sp.]